MIFVVAIFLVAIFLMAMFPAIDPRY